jgi:ABC-2 type transport system ATP-binding protein
MIKRVALARALALDPELVFLDEPTSALDPVGRRDVREIIRLLKSQGTTVFLNSHLLSEVEQVCDRVAVVDHGRVVATGSLEQLLGSGGVRIRVGPGFDHDAVSLQAQGRVERDGDWISVVGIKPEQVPDLVAEVVRLGGRVSAVEPQHLSLEDRFMQLLGEGESPGGGQ